eukprot:903469-Rhodomonas_salina.1
MGRKNGGHSSVQHVTRKGRDATGTSGGNRDLPPLNFRGFLPWRPLSFRPCSNARVPARGLTKEAVQRQGATAGWFERADMEATLTCNFRHSLSILTITQSNVPLQERG